MSLIAERGYAKTTLNEIANRLGVTKTVVYRVFPGKDLLLQALVDFANAQGLEPILRPLPEGLDPIEAVLIWTDRMLTAISANPQLWRMVLAAPEGVPLPIRMMIREGRDAARARLQELLGAVLASSPKGTGIDPEVSAHIFVAACEHAALMMLDGEPAFTHDRLVTFARNLANLFRD